MKIRLRFVTGASLFALTAASPLGAQAPAYFTSLTVPPANVGTCMPPRAALSGARVRSGPSLVMTSRTPGARREMSLMRDSTGRVIGFTEMLSLTTEWRKGTGESVVASVRADGGIAGFLLRTETSIPDGVLRPSDTAAVRRLRESTQQSSTRSALDAENQRQVRELVTWLAKRCPG